MSNQFIHTPVSFPISYNPSRHNEAPTSTCCWSKDAADGGNGGGWKAEAEAAQQQRPSTEHPKRSATALPLLQGAAGDGGKEAVEGGARPLLLLLPAAPAPAPAPAPAIVVVMSSQGGRGGTIDRSSNPSIGSSLSCPPPALHPARQDPVSCGCGGGRRRQHRMNATTHVHASP